MLGEGCYDLLFNGAGEPKVHPKAGEGVGEVRVPVQGGREYYDRFMTFTRY